MIILVLIFLKGNLFFNSIYEPVHNCEIPCDISIHACAGECWSQSHMSIFSVIFFCMCKCVWFVFVHVLMCVGTGVSLASSHTLNTCLSNFLLLSLRQDFSTEHTSFREVWFCYLAFSRNLLFLPFGNCKYIKATMATWNLYQSWEIKLWSSLYDKHFILWTIQTYNFLMIENNQTSFF